MARRDAFFANRESRDPKPSDIRRCNSPYPVGLERELHIGILSRSRRKILRDEYAMAEITNTVCP